MQQAASFQGGLFAEPSFRELSEWYDEIHLKTKAANTRDSGRSYIRQALAWLDARGITHPGPGEWQQYLLWRQDPACPERVTDLTAETHRKNLQRVYLKCRNTPKKGWLMIANPLDLAQVPRQASTARQRPRSMSEPYVTYPLLQAAMPDPLARAFISTLRWHGLRLQEALGIPLPGSELDRGLKYLNLEAGTLTVEKQRGDDTTKWSDLKTEFSRATIRLAPEPVQLLREALRWRQQQALNPTVDWRRSQGVCAQNFVFPYYRHQLQGLMGLHREVAPHDFPTWVRGVDGADTWHVYRHTFATEMYRAGIQGERLRTLLRHKDQRTMDAYLKALMVEVVEGDDLEDAWKVQAEKQAQALAERSGRGLSVVRTK
ncbi:hypothetical protein BO221_04895 [Archangium sp. Cb G35]|uniref:tyrosine-type recombinase/integrase n=1 Tax=Archangium sp. Cb G35 TaxID=1920190 RepID=UPI000935EC11|nr:site-specific integrase [Archangium sp. Cb G35]OJT27324.1 hypothetical protein BO221_04895 [Archangium sp. Cb G35]